MEAKRIAILGSTGSIGRQTMEVISKSESMVPCAIGSGTNVKLLAEQARTEGVEYVAVFDEQCATLLAPNLPDGVTLFRGDEALTQLVQESSPDVVVSAVVGSAGLASTLAAVKTCSTVALANKESLVCGGQLVMAAAAENGCEILPVDSEHSGIFQCLLAGRKEEIRRVIITSSGGAMRDCSEDQIRNATVSEVLEHPTWNMGPKITVDSSTLMNKALEVIEAHWLFALKAEQIEVVIHPQSIVHALVEFTDGSVIAQLAEPDMKLPIAYALNRPHRPCREFAPLDLPSIGSLDFRSVEGTGARVMELAHLAIRHGSPGGTVLNGANEVAVESFLSEEIRFGDIIPIVDKTFCRWANGCDTAPKPSGGEISLDDLLACDEWSRQQAADAVSAVKF